jgi:hypothetical protein
MLVDPVTTEKHPHAGLRTLVAAIRALRGVTTATGLGELICR